MANDAPGVVSVVRTESDRVASPGLATATRGARIQPAALQYMYRTTNGTVGHFIMCLARSPPFLTILY